MYILQYFNKQRVLLERFRIFVDVRKYFNILETKTEPLDERQNPRSKMNTLNFFPNELLMKI